VGCQNVPKWRDVRSLRVPLGIISSRLSSTPDHIPVRVTDLSRRRTPGAPVRGPTLRHACTAKVDPRPYACSVLQVLKLESRRAGRQEGRSARERVCVCAHPARLATATAWGAGRHKYKSIYAAGTQPGRTSRGPGRRVRESRSSSLGLVEHS